MNDSIAVFRGPQPYISRVPIDRPWIWLAAGWRDLWAAPGISLAWGLLPVVTGWLAFVRLMGEQSIANRPLLLFGILLVFTGVQLVTLGLLAELQARTYHESQNKPTYVIREVRESPTTPA